VNTGQLLCRSGLGISTSKSAVDQLSIKLALPSRLVAVLVLSILEVLYIALQAAGVYNMMQYTYILPCMP
jgi:hypothetical protein